MYNHSPKKSVKWFGADGYMSSAQQLFSAFNNQKSKAKSQDHCKPFKTFTTPKSLHNHLLGSPKGQRLLVGGPADGSARSARPPPACGITACPCWAPGPAASSRRGWRIASMGSDPSRSDGAWDMGGGGYGQFFFWVWGLRANIGCGSNSRAKEKRGFSLWFHLRGPFGPQPNGFRKPRFGWKCELVTTVLINT